MPHYLGSEWTMCLECTGEGVAMQLLIDKNISLLLPLQRKALLPESFLLFLSTVVNK